MTEVRLFSSIPLISIIVPVFNEEGNIERCYRELKSTTAQLNDYRFEFIFTDNHSTDQTFSILARLAASDPAVHVVRFARNFGFNRSVLTGYRLANGAAAIQIDADLQDPPGLFEPMLVKWREGHDVVVGIRRNRKENALLHRLRKGYYQLLAWLDGPHLVPNAGDFRLVDRTILFKLKVIDDAHPYLRGLISSLAANQTGIVYDRAERINDKSKFPIRKLIGLALDGILAHSNLPLRAAFHIGVFIAFIAMLLSAYYLFARLLFGHDWPPGFATTQLLILFGIGVNAVFLGVIGEYVGRIYNQVRRRPATVIEQTLNLGDSVEELERRLTLL